MVGYRAFEPVGGTSAAGAVSCRTDGQWHSPTSVNKYYGQNLLSNTLCPIVLSDFDRYYL